MKVDFANQKYWTLLILIISMPWTQKGLQLYTCLYLEPPEVTPCCHNFNPGLLFVKILLNKEPFLKFCGGFRQIFISQSKSGDFLVYFCVPPSLTFVLV